MINLTLIRLLADQLAGSLAEVRASNALSSGESDALDRSISTNNSISEEIENATAQTPVFARSFGDPREDNLEE